MQSSKQWSTTILSNTNPTKNRRWTQVLWKGRHFLFHYNCLLHAVTGSITLFFSMTSRYLTIVINLRHKVMRWFCVFYFGWFSMVSVIFMLQYKQNVGTMSLKIYFYCTWYGTGENSPTSRAFLPVSMPRTNTFYIQRFYIIMSFLHYQNSVGLGCC